MLGKIALIVLVGVTVFGVSIATSVAGGGGRLRRSP
jgi:hypothetical protein